MFIFGGQSEAVNGGSVTRFTIDGTLPAGPRVNGC